MAIDTNITYTDKDLGKNLYRQKRYYHLVIEQEVLAKNKDEADKLFAECGIDHSQINDKITETKGGVETYMVDANYSDSNDTEYVGKVKYEDEEYAKEDGLIEIDIYADEDALSDKEESDIDVALTLDAENERGK